MSLTRVTFFFEQEENGWSESYHNQNDPNTTATLNDVQNLLGVRMGLSPQNVSMTHIRISDDNVFRDVILDPIAVPTNGTFKEVGTTPGTPWNALNVRMSAEPAVTTVQRTLFLRGIPREQVQNNVTSFTPAYLRAFGAYGRALIGRSWGIKAKNRANLPQPIGSVTPAGVVTMLSPLANVANLSRVQLKGVKRSLVPQRLYTAVQVNSPTSFTLKEWAGQTLANIGTLTLVTPLIYSIGKVLVDSATERRTGRPFGVLRGRAAIRR